MYTLPSPFCGNGDPETDLGQPKCRPPPSQKGLGSTERLHDDKDPPVQTSLEGDRSL